MTHHKLIQGDCLEAMKDIPDSSVDLILCDLPYGVTQNKKDVKINLKNLWKQYKGVSKDNTTTILTSQFPFTLELINSNKNLFKYDLIWDKILSSGFLNAKKMPLRTHEYILVFYKNRGVYNPQFEIGNQNHSKGTVYKTKPIKNQNYGKFGVVEDTNSNLKYPKSILSFQKPHPSKTLHPTQKPVALFEYLIKTYSNEGGLVLDNCAGSGTTMQACVNTKRNSINIEISEKYCDIIKERCFGQQSLFEKNTFEFEFKVVE